MRQVLLIPCKPFNEAKTRLAGLLDKAARRELARALLINTLQAVLACKGLETFVVASDAEALGIAKKLGVGILAEEASEGLNSSLEKALMRFPASHDLRFAYLPTDLIDLRAIDARELFYHPGMNEANRILIAPDSRHEGTNFLSWPADCGLRMLFGGGSFAAYMAEARRLSIPIDLITMLWLRHDLDSPEDMDRYQRRAPQGG